MTDYEIAQIKAGRDPLTGYELTEEGRKKLSEASDRARMSFPKPPQAPAYLRMQTPELREGLEAWKRASVPKFVSAEILADAEKRLKEKHIQRSDSLIAQAKAGKK